MGQALLLREHESLPVQVVNPDPWLKLTYKQRDVAQNRLIICQFMIDLENRGRTTSKAYQSFCRKFQLDRLQPHIKAAIEFLDEDSNLPNRATVYRWLKGFRSKGLLGLAPTHRGRQRKICGWEQQAIDLYGNPAKPSMNYVARKLREDYGFADASDDKVRRFLNSLPKQMSHRSAPRLGYNQMRKTQKNCLMRSADNLPVGFLYQGDGHRIDVYLAHPNSGEIWRGEMTVWLDVKSRYVVAWQITNDESSLSTMTCLSEALIHHDHVPGILYIDNGSGFKSKIMTNERYGFYKKFDIDIQFSLPGNPGAKGNVERFFRTMEADFCKEYGEAYCGDDIDAHISSRFVNDCNNGKKQPPSLEEFKLRFEHWLNKYHHRPHPEYKDTTPAKMWATLEKSPLVMPPGEVNRPREERVVQRETVSINNRKYYNRVLLAYNGDTVMCEFAWNTDTEILIMTQQGQFICNAKLIHKAPHIPDSRIEEQEQKRLKGQKKRLEIKLQKKIAESRGPITAESTVNALEDLGNDLLSIPLEQTKPEDEIKLNLLDY